MAQAPTVRVALFGPDKRHGARLKPKMPDHRYVAWWYVPNPNGGKPIRRERVFAAGPNQSYADKLAELERELANAGNVDQTIENALVHYLENRRGKVLAFDSLASKAQAIANTLGNLRITDITEEVCETYQATRGITQNTARTELGVLAAAINYCHRKLKWPTVDLWRPQKSASSARVLTEGEIKAILTYFDGCGEWHHGLTFLVQTYMAQRANAVLKLRWDISPLGGHVSLVHGTIDFNPAGRAKSTKEKPFVPMGREVAAALKMAYEANQERTSPSPWVFAGPKGTEPKYEAYCKAIARACEATGVARFTPHRTRHTRITGMLAVGKSPVLVGRFAGVSQRTMDEVYTHLAPETLRDVAGTPLRRKAS